MKTAWQTYVLTAAMLLTLVQVQAAGADLPSAVVSDPVRDPKFPAANQPLSIPSGDASMNGLLMQASGSASKPTLLLRHGLPGDEKNLDLAQAIRRSGWNVLTVNYRGNWGSPGVFSIAGAVDDAAAAMAYLRRPEIAVKYRIDPNRLAIGGHSMGGFAAAYYASRHPELVGLLLLDFWNVGAVGKKLRDDPANRPAFVRARSAAAAVLPGASGEALTEEILRRADDWDVMAMVPAMAAVPTLIIGATGGNAERSKALAEAIGKHKGKVNSITLTSDHAFSDHRVTLSGIVVDWLQGK